MRQSFLCKATAFLLVLTIVLALPAFAAGEATATVSGGTIRLRAEPSLTAQVLDILPGGTTVTVLDTTPVTNASGSWYKVKYKETIGYMSADYLTVAGAVGSTASITTDRLNFRASPSTSSEVLLVLTKGAVVTILGSDSGGWQNVSYKSTNGYVKSEFLNLSGESKADSGNVSGKYGQVTSSRVNFRATANMNSSVKAVLSMGDVLDLKGSEGEWYSATYNDIAGYIHSDYIKVTAEKPAKSSVSNSSAYSEGTEALADTDASQKQAALVETALSKLGSPYVYGANGPNSFDCSGYTSWVYRQYGTSLNRTAVDQYRLNGTKISSTSALMPGDLVFVRDLKVSSNVVTHVGIYIGQGKMVHAGTGSTRCVKITPLTSGYYKNLFVAGKRIIS